MFNHPAHIHTHYTLPKLELPITLHGIKYISLNDAAALFSILTLEHKCITGQRHTAVVAVR